MSVTIRPIQFTNDISAIMRLEEVTFGDDAFPLSEFQHLFFRGRDTFLVAIIEDQLVGYISAYAFQQIGYIASIAINTTHRRQRIGHTLMSHVLATLTEKKQVKLIHLHVRQSNAPAIALYQSLGFSIRGQEDHYYGNEGAYIMSYIVT